jgi:hypothetical protein
MWVMLGIAALLLLPVLKSAALSRRSGVAFLVIYVAYVVHLGIAG